MQVNLSFWLTLVSISVLKIVTAWPDGAPCVHAAFESMNPLEAVEHQGGLQLTPPPFHIEVDRQCYWKNQPIGVTLKGNTSTTKFKGFVIQPIVWKGSKYGRRIGQFMRLDDNGSWQNQCFSKKDSVTHSHDTMKTFIKLWWKNDEDDVQYIQFVSTVVVHIKQFWVKSVLSVPIPPCRVEPRISAWIRPPVTAPPPPSQFKMDTWRIFEHESRGTFVRSINSFDQRQNSFKQAETTARTQFNAVSGDVSQFRPTTPAPRAFPVATTTATPTTVTRRLVTIPPTTGRSVAPGRQKLTHIIPLPNMETNSRHRSSSSTGLQPPASVTRLISQQRPQQPSATVARLMQLNRQIAMRIQNQQQQRRMELQQLQQQQQQQQQQQAAQCFDLNDQNQCFGWLAYCRQSAWMQFYCRRTCRMC